jgi:hypothetical protein
MFLFKDLDWPLAPKGGTWVMAQVKDVCSVHRNMSDEVSKHADPGMYCVVDLRYVPDRAFPDTYGRVYGNLDPLEVQCVVSHLMQEPLDAGT